MKKLWTYKKKLVDEVIFNEKDFQSELSELCKTYRMLSSTQQGRRKKILLEQEKEFWALLFYEYQNIFYKNKIKEIEALLAEECS